MKRKIFEKVDCGEYYDYYFNNKDFIIEVSQDKLVPNRYLTLKNGQKIQSVYLWLVPKHHKDYCTIGIFVPCDVKYLDQYLKFYHNLCIKKYKVPYRWLIKCIKQIKKEYDEQGTTII